ncbi:MAG: hypothetical protein EAZ55_11865 [Cytophagales bacterium]|nr:MAG: hypothetical protein EAZ55_11865 [Cytophagales bacterium]
MKLFQNAYIQIDYDADTKTIMQVSFPESTHMEVTDFKEAFEEASRCVEIHQPLYYLSDVRQQFFPIGPDLQEWIAQNVYPRWHAAGLRKLAIIIPSELISNLSIQQTVDEVNEIRDINSYEIRYFDDIAAAKQWFYN